MFASGLVRAILLLLFVWPTVEATGCGLHAHMPAGNTSCTCNVGSTGLDSGSCSLCAAGTFKSANGSGVCEVCPSNSRAPEGSSFCTCDAGHGKYRVGSNTNTDLAETKTNVGGWRLVRFLPPSATQWYNTDDNLQGTVGWGTAYSHTSEWSIPFDDFDEFLIGTYNLKHWL